MAVQKSRKTRSRRDMRRSHDSLKANALSVDQLTGETHLRYNLTKDGYYRGRQIIVPKVAKEEKDNTDSKQEPEKE